MSSAKWQQHDDVIQWKHFPRYWPFVQGIHRSLMNSPHKGQWCGALMFSLIWASVNAWVNNLEASDLRCHHAHYDVSVMFCFVLSVLTDTNMHHQEVISKQISCVTSRKICCLTNMGIPITKIRQSHDHTIFIMEISIPVKKILIMKLPPHLTEWRQHNNVYYKTFSMHSCDQKSHKRRYI